MLCRWSMWDGDFADDEVLVLTDQDGFIPGQIYYDNFYAQGLEHGEFITGLVSFCLYLLFISFLYTTASLMVGPAGSMQCQESADWIDRK